MEKNINLVKLLNATAKYMPEENIKDFLNEVDLELDQYDLADFNNDEIEAIIKFDTKYLKANILADYISKCYPLEIKALVEEYVEDINDLSDSAKNAIIEKLSNINLKDYDIIEEILFDSPFVRWYNDENIEDMYYVDLSEFDLSVMHDSVLSLETIRDYFNCYIKEQTGWFTLNNIDYVIFNEEKGLATYLAENYSASELTVDFLSDWLHVNKEEIKEYIDKNIDDPYINAEYEELYCDAAAQILIHYEKYN